MRWPVRDTRMFLMGQISMSTRALEWENKLGTGMCICLKQYTKKEEVRHDVKGSLCLA